MKLVFASAALGAISLSACVHRSSEIELPHVQWHAIPVEFPENESDERIADSDADRLLV